MKLDTLNLRNFTCYDKVEIEFPNTVNLFVGENASGKTSIKDAIHYALTGHCARTDGGGKGAENMIREGARKAEINLSINNLDIRRTIPGGLELQDIEGGTRKQQEVLYEELGISKEVLDAVLDTESMINARGKEIKQTLFGLVGVSFDKDDIINEILSTVPQRLKDTVIKLLKSAPQRAFVGSSETFDNLYKHFYTLRKEFKKQLSNIGEVEELPEEITGSSVLEVKKAIARKRKEASVISKELIDIRSAEGKREHITNEVENLTKRLKTANKSGGGGKKVQDEYKKVLNEIKTIESESETIESKVKEIENVIKTFKKSGSLACPVAPELITCPVEGNDLDNMVKEITEKQKELSDKIPELKENLKKVRAKRGRLEKKLEEVSGPDPDEIKKEIDRLKGELPSSVDKTYMKELEEALREFSIEIENLEETLAETGRVEGSREVAKEKARRKEELTVDVKAMEWLVKKVGADGIPAQLLDEAIGPVEKEANERLEQLTNGEYSLQIEVEPDFIIMVTHGGVTTDLKRLSSSERLRLGIILQDAIARLARARLLVIDNADLLDSQNRVALMKLLVAIKDDYNSIVVLATKSVPEVKNPHIDDFAVFEMIDGVPVEVE
jgi:DNA repair exonuclease SbcCD ATPase subunit